MFGAVLGKVLLGDQMMCHGWSGVLLLVIGIILVSTDNGEKVQEGGGSDEDQEAPPLLVWIGPALLTALSYAFYNSESLSCIVLFFAVFHFCSDK